MRYGSLCSGIGGLDLAVEAVFDATPAWFCEADRHAATVLERHWPGVPILPDLKTQDWTQVAPVELVCAGYPCQPFSHAGKRGGTDDPRHLWPFVRDAVRVLRPRLVVLENVAGHLSLGFDTVLGDLAEAGFDAEWTVVRASDVGACHQRARLFVVATDPGLCVRREEDPRGRGVVRESGAGAGRDARGLPRPAQEGRRPGADVQSAVDAGQDSPHADDFGLQRGGAHGDGGLDLRTVVADTLREGLEGTVREGVQGDRPGLAWGDYEAAIRRHEHTLGRPAPAPTDQRERLAVPFVEWMQMLPEGWVDGLTRTQALKCLGNCVVPAQAVAALKALA